VALALAWLVVGAGTELAGARAGAAGAEAIWKTFAAMLDVHMMRIQANMLRAALQLQSWADLAAAWSPVVLAGVLDGFAQRRARRCSLQAAPDVGLQLGRHALVALCFAPWLWASLDANLAPWGMGSWAIAVSASLSFTLSRVQGLGLRR
jgi:hypothetical protein